MGDQAARKFEEVTPYITRTGGGLVTHVISMKKERYDGLPGWAKEVIDRVFKELKQENLGLDRMRRAILVEQVVKKAKIYTPTEAERKLWFAAAPGSWLKVKGRYDPDIARRVLKEQGQDDLIKLMEKAGAL